MKRFVTSLIFTMLALAGFGCTRPSLNNPKEVYGPHNNPIEMVVCNHLPQDLYLAVGGHWDTNNFSRGWLRLPQGDTDGPSCTEAHDFFYMYPGNVTPTDPSAETDRYGVALNGSLGFIRTDSSVVVPEGYASLGDMRDQTQEALCIPNGQRLGGAAASPWLGEYAYDDTRGTFEQACPEGSSAQASFPLAFEWDSSIAAPLGSGESGPEEAGERFSLHFRDGQLTAPEGADQYGYRNDSPVPVEVRDTVRKDIIPVAPEKGMALEDALKKWEGRLTPQQINVLLTVRAIGVAFRDLASETSEFGKRAQNWLDGAVKSAKEGVTCATKVVAAGDYGDLYEIMSGKDLCSGEDITFAGRVLSGAALIGGSGKFWRVVGEVAGMTPVVKKIAKKVPDLLPAAVHTVLNGKVRKVEKQVLADSFAATFADGAYETFEVTEKVVIYRVWGIYPSQINQPPGQRGAEKVGGFFTTYAPKDRLEAKIDLALVPRWKNARLQATAFELNPGVKINVGIVGPQTIPNTQTILQGGAPQIYIDDWRKVAQHLEAGEMKELHSLDLNW